MFSHRGLALSLNHDHHHRDHDDHGDHGDDDHDDNGDHDKDTTLWFGVIILVIMIVVMIKIRNYGRCLGDHDNYQRECS